jgi:hypothetical protein
MRHGTEAWMTAIENCEPYINSLSLIRQRMGISLDLPFKPPRAETLYTYNNLTFWRGPDRKSPSSTVMPHPVHDRNNQSTASYTLLGPKCNDDICFGSIQFFLNGKLKRSQVLMFSINKS